MICHGFESYHYLEAKFSPKPVYRYQLSNFERQIYISSSILYILVDFRLYYYQYCRLIFMAVTTLAGGKIGTQKIKCHGLLLLDKTHKFQNLHKYIQQNNKILFSFIYSSFLNNHPPPHSLAYFFSKVFQPPTVIRNQCLLASLFSGKHL